MLEALLRASPRTLSTEDLLEQAWDEHTDPFTKTVQVRSVVCDANSAILM